MANKNEKINENFYKNHLILCTNGMIVMDEEMIEKLKNEFDENSFQNIELLDLLEDEHYKN